MRMLIQYCTNLIGLAKIECINNKCNRNPYIWNLCEKSGLSWENLVIKTRFCRGLYKDAVAYATSNPNPKERDTQTRARTSLGISCMEGKTTLCFLMVLLLLGNCAHAGIAHCLPLLSLFLCSLFLPSQIAALVLDLWQKSASKHLDILTVSSGTNHAVTSKTSMNFLYPYFTIFSQRCVLLLVKLLFSHQLTF